MLTLTEHRVALAVAFSMCSALGQARKPSWVEEKPGAMEERQLQVRIQSNYDAL